jgi:flagellar motility protein MotE (MotC chaperone)
MIRYIRDLRLIPIALIASACLLALKIADLALDGSRWFAAERAPANEEATVIRTSPDAAQPPGAQLSWAQQMFNFPGGSGAVSPTGITPAERATADRVASTAANPDITGSITTTPASNTPGAPGAPAATPEASGKDGKPPPDGVVIPTSGASLPSGSERAILQRLAQRREELDARARELDIRESLVKAAEQRIDAHLAEIKEIEARIKTETVQKDQAEVTRFKGLVTMYESMKPRDAAKIFDGLDMDVLIKVASQMNPRAMADILAQMTPEMAERLTVALASKAQETPKSSDRTELPKIEGKPTMP